MNSTKITNRKIAIVNQATNYLTIGFANEFKKKFDHVALITGSIHSQGEELEGDIEVRWINRWIDRPFIQKNLSFLVALIRIWLLLLTRYRDYEILFISVPPMAYLLNLVVRNKCSMIIWDVYPDALMATKLNKNNLVFKLWSWLNTKSFDKAFCIYTISDSMAELLEKYINKNRIYVLPIWSIFQEKSNISIDENFFIKDHGLKNKFVVQYSGNIGYTHNVEILIDIASKFVDNDKIVFQIIGRGPRFQYISDFLKKRNYPNVQLLPFQPDHVFPYSLSAANLGVVILNESVSKGSVPSKVYNQMSFGIPGLYITGRDSELYKYSYKFKNGAAFNFDEIDSICEFITQLSTNSKLYELMKFNSSTASLSFRRKNATRFVDLYLSTKF